MPTIEGGKESGIIPASGDITGARGIDGGGTVSSAGTAAPSDGASSRELASLVARIARLADGNGASKDDVKLVGGDAQLRSVHLILKIALTWVSATKAYSGNHAVDGSSLFGTAADAQRHLDALCRTACQDPATSTRVAGLLSKASVSALDTYKDGCDLGALPFRAHHVEDCSGCGGGGLVRCPDTRCISGQVGCIACNQTGQATCGNCSGSGHVSENGRFYTCGRCGGRGRASFCIICAGTGFVDCQTCRASGQVGCKPCGATGCFTQVHGTRLVGRVSHSMGFRADAPVGFQRSCAAVEPLASLATSVGSLVNAQASSTAGEAVLSVRCNVTHARADMTCNMERIHVDALGLGQAIPLMPTFLDGLTCELADDICKAELRNPAGALALALNARLTRDILTVVGKGKRPDAAEVVRRWSSAVSEGHVAMLAASLGKSYSRAARSLVRRSWLLMSPIIVATSILLNAYQLPYRMVKQLHLTNTPSAVIGVALVTLIEVASMLPVVLVAWLVAGWVGRRQLRAGVGALARRGPRQGPWPALGLCLAVATGWTAVVLQLDAEPMGLPLAPATRPGGRSLVQAFTAGPPPSPVRVPLNDGPVHAGQRPNGPGQTARRL